MRKARAATLSAALLIGGCDFGIDTTGLVGDGSASDVGSSSDAAADASDVVSQPESGPTVLFGDTNVEPNVVSLTGARPDGYRFIAQATGNAATVWFYVDSQTSGALFDVGIYDDDSSQATPQPKSLLAQATFSATPGLWNSQPISSTPITSGNAYWIVVDVTSGSFYYRNAGGSSGTIESIAASTSTLPTTWTTASTLMDGPGSMYVTQ